MNPSPPRDSLIERALRCSVQFFTFASMLLPKQPGALVSAALMQRITDECLLPAEAFLRRALFLIAATLPALPVVAPTPRAKVLAGRRAPTAPAKPRAPLFRLTDPMPRPQTDHRPPRAAAPKAPRAPKPAPDLTELNAKFQNRLAALRGACAFPKAAAERLRRRLAARPTATCPLSPEPPAGLTATRLTGVRETYAELAGAATRVWPRLVDSS